MTGIAIVVVTHGIGAEDLERCLRSILDAGGADGVLVVDNGVGTALGVHGVDRVHAVNRGYGAAANLGLRRVFATGASIGVLVNDDLVVEPGWLTGLVSALHDDAGLGAAQPKLLLAGTDPVLINSAGVRVGPDGAGRDIGYGEPDGPSFDQAGTIQAFTGGAVALRREFFEQLGGFDERYFLYYEDVDLARRGTEAGWRYRYVPTSRVHHVQGVSTSAGAEVSERTVFLQERNRLWTAVRFGSPATIMRALWLSVRRLRHSPRRVHARALAAGLAAVPRLVRSRRGRPRRIGSPEPSPSRAVASQ